MPHVCVLKLSGIALDRDFWAGLSESLVSSRTESGDRTLCEPNRPWFRSIRVNARKSSHVDTSPPAPEVNAGSLLHWPAWGLSVSASPPDSGLYALTRR